MVATIKKSPRTTDTASLKKCDRSSAAFLHVSRLSDLNDDVTLNALRRAAEIRQAWSEEEVARRKTVGQQRRNELTELLNALGK